MQSVQNIATHFATNVFERLFDEVADMAATKFNIDRQEFIESLGNLMNAPLNVSIAPPTHRIKAVRPAPEAASSSSDSVEPGAPIVRIPLPDPPKSEDAKLIRKTVAPAKRCQALTQSGHQCTLRHHKGESFCGNHLNNTKYGVVPPPVESDSESKPKRVRKPKAPKAETEKATEKTTEMVETEKVAEKESAPIAKVAEEPKSESDSESKPKKAKSAEKAAEAEKPSEPAPIPVLFEAVVEPVVEKATEKATEKKTEKTEKTEKKTEKTEKKPKKPVSIKIPITSFEHDGTDYWMVENVLFTPAEGYTLKTFLARTDLEPIDSLEGIQAILESAGFIDRKGKVNIFNEEEDEDEVDEDSCAEESEEEAESDEEENEEDDE